jgi:drug/metabolite transporter (DMT)-like permease
MVATQSQSRPHAQEHAKAIAMLLLGNVFWGLSFPVIRAVEMANAAWVPTGSWFVVAYTIAPRFAIALAIVLVVQARGGYGMTRREFSQGAILGFFGAGGILLQNDGLRFTAASTSAFLTQFYAVLIPIWLAIRTRRNPGAFVWVSCSLVLTGVAILGRFDWSAMRLGRGEVETLGSSLFFMGQILYLEDRRFAGNRGSKVTLVMFVGLAFFFGLLAVASAPSARALVAPWMSPSWLGLTLTLGVFCTVGAFSIMNAWQPKITATEAGLLYCTEPIFASAMALFLPAIFSQWAGIAYLNESATLNLAVGGGLVTLANVLIQFRRPEPAKNAP